MKKLKKFFLYCFFDNPITTSKQRGILQKNLIIAPFFALIELLGLGLIILFLINILDPKFINIINNLVNTYLNTSLEISNINLFFLCLILILLKYFFQYRLIVLTFKNLEKIHFEITMNHLKLTLHSNSEYLLKKNISGIIRTIINDTQLLFIDFIRPSIEIFKELFIIFFVASLLIFFNGPKIFFIFILFLFLVILLTKLASNISKKISQTRFIYDKKFFKNLSEFFLLIKELRMKNLENEFFFSRQKEFKLSTDAFAKENIKGHQLKFIFEGIFIISIFLIIGYLIFISKTNFENIYEQLIKLIIPTLRLMPSFVRINGYINKINFNYGVIDAVEQNLINLQKERLTEHNFNINFNKSIKIENFNFDYNKKIIFENSNIEIFKNKTHAIVGPTGSGKSSFVEILLGFKKLNIGNIKVDELEINLNKLDSYSWRKYFGYVPQDTYIIDSDLKKNITLSDKKLSQEEEEKLLNILKYLQLKDLDNYEDILTKELGSFGKKISGGQKQRIGLARALYKNPDIIILDEPTSSLNKEKAEKIIETMINLGKTLIIITHDETILNKFDYIYLIKNHKIEKVT